MINIFIFNREYIHPFLLHLFLYLNLKNVIIILVMFILLVFIVLYILKHF